MSEDNEVEHLPYDLSQPDLHGALGFTLSDLPANRAGLLSPHQRAFQVRLLKRSAVASSIMLLVVLGGGALAFLAGVETDTGSAVLLIALLLLVFPGLGAWFMFGLVPDVRVGSVAAAQGFIRPRMQRTVIRRTNIRRTAYWSYYWDLDGGQRFRVPGRAYAALSPGRYRIYYLPRSRRVVGVEAIGSGE